MIIVTTRDKHFYAAARHSFAEEVKIRRRKVQSHYNMFGSYMNERYAGYCNNMTPFVAATKTLVVVMQ